MTVKYLALRPVLGAKYNMADDAVHGHMTTMTNILASIVHDFYVNWPKQMEKQAIFNTFNSHKQMPMCIGIIDGTLVQTFGFYERREEMNTRKCHYGFNVLLISDDQVFIRQDWCDQAGSEADSTILRESDFYNSIAEHVGNTNCPARPFYLISDKSIQSYDDIVFPFQEVGYTLSNKQQYFNAKLQQARALIERVNGVVKSRYSSVGDGLRVSELKIEQMVAACVALHNFDLSTGDLVLFNNEYNIHTMTESNIALMAIPYSYLPAISTRSWLFDLMTSHIL